MGESSKPAESTLIYRPMGLEELEAESPGQGLQQCNFQRSRSWGTAPEILLGFVYYQSSRPGQSTLGSAYVIYSQPCEEYRFL